MRRLSSLASEPKMAPARLRSDIGRSGARAFHTPSLYQWCASAWTRAYTSPLPIKGQCRKDVRSFEIVALEQEGLVRRFGEGVGETVAEVESCRVFTLSEASPGATSCNEVLCRYWRKLYA